MLTCLQLKRQHSAEPLGESAATRKSPHIRAEDSPGGTPQSANSTSANAGTPPESMSPKVSHGAADAIASPFKRHRASVHGLDNAVFGQLDANLNGQASANDFDAAAKKQDEQHEALSTPDVKVEVAMDSDEEL